MRSAELCSCLCCLGFKASSCEPSHARLSQFCEVIPSHSYQLKMSACIERNFLIASQTLVRINRYVVQISERRHCSCLAIGKAIFEFLLGRKRRICYPC